MLHQWYIFANQISADRDYPFASGGSAQHVNLTNFVGFSIHDNDTNNNIRTLFTDQLKTDSLDTKATDMSLDATKRNYLTHLSVSQLPRRLDAVDWTVPTQRQRKDFIHKYDIFSKYTFMKSRALNTRATSSK